MLLTNAVTLVNTESCNIHSSHVSQEYSISIGLPPTYANPNTRFPVLYILDGNVEFPLMKSICELLWLGREISEAILVGIGYPTSNLDEMLPLRTRDLTPTARGPGTGGAEAFLLFIHHELIPFVDRDYRTDPGLGIMFGDSRGGLFALYALFSAPGLFHRYLIVSPSIWWDERAVFELERNYAKQHSDLTALVCMSAGALENKRMVANVIKLRRALRTRQYPSLTLAVHILQGETHYSVIPAAVCRGLKTILGRPPNDRL